MKAGVTKDGRVVTLVTVVEGVAAYKIGNLNDGRFSGGTHGATVGYVSSEAAGGTYAGFVTMAAKRSAGQKVLVHAGAGGSLHFFCFLIR
jgi:hypothetical protein